MSEIPENKTIDTFEDQYQIKKTSYQKEIVQWIKEAEEELADLYLRKALLEADFETLLQQYRQLILAQQPFSTIAKTNLLEYLSYYLLEPFHSIGMQQTDHYNTWETNHFYVAYQLNEANHLVLHFQLKVIDERFFMEYIPLITLDMDKMEVTIAEKEVHTLISLWYSDKYLSRTQLSLFNQDLNRLFVHLKALGFNILPSLLDNTQALSLQLISDFPASAAILDQIFITTMESEEYDFDKIGSQQYQVMLTQGQTMKIDIHENQTVLFIDSNLRKRSILDFVTSYPFLVPLFVQVRK